MGPATYTMRCGTTVDIIRMSAHDIAAALPAHHKERYGLAWTLAANADRSFGAYADGSLAAFSVNRDEGSFLHHGLVERIAGAPRGIGRLVFAHDGYAVSFEDERDAWVVDAAHPVIDALLRTRGYAPSGRSGPSTQRYHIDLKSARERKTLRKRMRSVLSRLTSDASYSIV